MATHIGRGQLTLTDLNDVIASSTEPSNPSEGSLWFNKNDITLYVYNNGTWILASPELQIGGRNLVVNSTFNNGTTDWSGKYQILEPEDDKSTSRIMHIQMEGSEVDRHSQSWCKEIDMSINIDKQYTLSFDIKVENLSIINEEDVLFNIRTFSEKGKSDSADALFEKTIKKKDIPELQNSKWHRYSLTFSPNAGEYIRVSPYLTRNGSVSWREIKLEIGGKATDWSPAPEDVASSITDITETLGNMANDNILDYSERQLIKDKITEIIGYVILDTDQEMPPTSLLDQGINGKGSFYSTRKNARMSGLPSDNQAYTSLEEKYNNLKVYLESLTPIKPWDIVVEDKNLNIYVEKDEFRKIWLEYYNAERDLANATADKLKKNVDDIAVGGTNYASNGSFSHDIKKSLWASHYVGNTVEVIDISTETPPFHFALHVKNTYKVNGGIFTPVIFEGEAANSLKDEEITISFWLKYQDIVQGDIATDAAYFGRLIIEGEDDNGNKSYLYPRVSLATNSSGYEKVTGTNTEWAKYYATHKIALPVGAVKITKISFTHGMIRCTGEFWTTGLKLEIGNKVTDWSPCPYDLEDRITKTEFKVLDDQIISTVTGSREFADTINNKVTDSLSDIAVGGTNLVKNSDFSFDLKHWRDWRFTAGTRGIKEITDLAGFTKGFYYSTTEAGQFGYSQDNINVIEGETYVLTAWFKVTSGTGKVALQEGTAAQGWTLTNYDVENIKGKWVRLKHVFTARAHMINVYAGQSSDGSGISSAEITGIQLERGNIPTDWSPAPEDIQDSIQVGGRNLIKNSAVRVGFTNWTTISNGFTVDTSFLFNEMNTIRFNYKDSSYPALGSNFVNVKDLGITGQYLTLSTYLYIPSDVTFKGNAIYFEFCGYESTSQTANHHIARKTIPTNEMSEYAGKWVRLSCTAKVPDSNSNGKVNYVRALLRYDASNGSATENEYFWYALPKLEVGNRVTDWTPATEDIDYRFTTTESKIDQHSDQIALVVSGTTIKGDAIASSIVTTPTAISLLSDNINLKGKVSFESLDDTMKSSISNDVQTINKNPYFTDWIDPARLPVGYYSSNLGAGTSFSRITSPDQKGYLLKFNIPSDGVNAYLTPYEVTTSPYYQYITVQATFMLESGSIDGSGVLMRYNATSNVDHMIRFKDLVPSPSPNKWYTVTKVIKQIAEPSGFHGYHVYPVGGWSVLESVKAKTIYFSEISARPSTEQEIKAYESGLTIDQWKGAVVNGKTTINGGLLETNTVDARVLKAGSVIAKDIIFTGELKGATGTFSGKITSVNLDLQPDVSSWSGESVFRMFMGAGSGGGYIPGSVDFAAFGNSLTIAGSGTNVLQYVYINSNVNISGNVDLQNKDLNNVNHITINDPGSGEGLEWLRGNGWRIVEAPDNMTNDKGNIQIAQGGGTSSRRITINTDGNIHLYSGAGNLMGSVTGAQVRILDTGGTWVNYYVKPADNGEVRVQGSFSEAYRPIRASSFPTSSSINYKTNIESLTYEDAKFLLDNAEIFKYHLLSNVENGIYDKPKIGMISEMVPQQLRDEDGVDPYSVVSALWRIVQHHQGTINDLKVQIQDLTEAMTQEENTTETGGN
ncbi:phage head spike fiber domain-containing protein [Bacillus licheniformis]|uniref:phage head spike fiber domain-containing protein n=1 Tax=Bacillus licheniformis TaxID=1402 RepID=UPI00092B6739|nr:hypothetical protein [Bacillus licheniformis]OJT57280.1 hypothetical protein BFP47_11230 [Bacillus licheniformis]OJT70078.1 hypothetical protein BFP46_05660 [Bacillus licheniformis]